MKDRKVVVTTSDLSDVCAYDYLDGHPVLTELEHADERIEELELVKEAMYKLVLGTEGIVDNIAWRRVLLALLASIAPVSRFSYYAQART